MQYTVFSERHLTAKWGETIPPLEDLLYLKHMDCYISKQCSWCELYIKIWINIDIKFYLWKQWPTNIDKWLFLTHQNTQNKPFSVSQNMIFRGYRGFKIFSPLKGRTWIFLKVDFEWGYACSKKCYITSK